MSQTDPQKVIVQIFLNLKSYFMKNLWILFCVLTIIGKSQNTSQITLNTGYDHDNQSTLSIGDHDGYWALVSTNMSQSGFVPQPGHVVGVQGSFNWDEYSQTKWINWDDGLSTTGLQYSSGSTITFERCFNSNVTTLGDFDLEVMGQHWVKEARLINQYNNASPTVTSLFSTSQPSQPHTSLPGVTFSGTKILRPGKNCVQVDVEVIWTTTELALDLKGTVTDWNNNPNLSELDGQNYISGSLYNDLDGNGTRNNNQNSIGYEGPLVDWKVKLIENGQTVEEVFSSGNGYYCFGPLDNGSYDIEVEIDGHAWILTEGTNPYTTTVTDHQVDNNVNFGFHAVHDFSLNKSISSFDMNTNEITYEIEYCNIGQAASPSLWFDEYFPSCFTYVSHQFGNSCQCSFIEDINDPSHWYAFIDALNPAECQTLFITGTINPFSNDCSNCVNTNSLDAATPGWDLFPDNNESCIDIDDYCPEITFGIIEFGNCYYLSVNAVGTNNTWAGQLNYQNITENTGPLPLNAPLCCGTGCLIGLYGDEIILSDNYFGCEYEIDIQGIGGFNSGLTNEVQSNLSPLRLDSEINLRVLSTSSNSVYVQFDSPLDIKGNLQVFDINGQLVFSQKQIDVKAGVNNFTLNTNNIELTHGVYIAVVSTEIGITSQKFIVSP